MPVYQVPFNIKDYDKLLNKFVTVDFRFGKSAQH